MEFFSIVPKENVPDFAWDTFVDKCPDAWLLHRRDMLDAFNSWEFNRDISFAIQREDEIVGVFPLLIKKIPYKRVFNINYLDSAGGLALGGGLSDDERKCARELVKVYLKKLSRKLCSPRITIVKSGLAPILDGKGDLSETGDESLIDANCSTHSYHVDLRKNVEDLWKGMQGRSRTAIRKAEKSGVVVRAAQCNDQDIALYYSLHKETCRRTGVRPHPIAFFETVWEKFLSRGLCAIWFAELDGSVVAACNTGAYKKRAHYWTGASLLSGQRVGANNLLIWTAIKHYKENKYLKFDCGEAFVGGQTGKLKGLSDFKSSFGGDLVPYFKGTIRSESRFINFIVHAREIARFCGVLR